MKRIAVTVFYGLVSLSVLWPLLGRGYILTLDMVFTPHLRLPDHVGSSYAFYALLHYLNVIIPADVIQKLLLLTIFVAAGWGMHRLIVYIQQLQRSSRQPASWQLAGCAVGSCLYMVNPFTYERLMAGQFAVLLGYALLPWFTRSLLIYLHRPTWTGILQTTLLTVGIGIVSIHSLGAVAVLVGVAASGLLFRHHWPLRRQRTPTPAPGWKVYGQHALAGAALFVILSSYWLIPFATGHSLAAQQVGRFGPGDQQAFATSGSNAASKITNVLQLRGFWAERHILFTLPWNKIGAAWYLVSALVVCLVIVGAVGMWRGGQPTMTLFLGIIIGLGAVCASGLIIGTTLSQHGLLAGFREPQKFTMLIALGYSVGLAFGVTIVLTYWSTMFTSWPSRTGAAVVCASLPFVWSMVMLWGCSGQLTPRQYPADWFAANKVLGQLTSRTKTTQTLFLPWHLYLHTDFAGRTIANPAPAFFDLPIVISDNPELPGAAIDRPSELSRHIDQLVGDYSSQATRPASLLSQLKKLGIGYIILAKENDYRDYQAIVSQPGVRPVVQTPTITLYSLQPKEETSYVPAR